MTIQELIAEGMAKATHCEQCGEEFTADRTKMEPDRDTVYWTNEVSIICYYCAEDAWERWNDRMNEM